MEKNTLLIVDDILINREMLKFIFAEQFQILEAEDGNQAVELLKENQDKIVLIFLDLVMPEKSGLDVLDYMKKNGYMDHIPVIVITGEATADAEERAYEYGASDIIYKPFEPKVVMRRTMNIIELFQHRIHLEQKLLERTVELRRSKERLAQNNEFLLNAMSAIVEYRGLETKEHTFRVKYLTRIMMRQIVDCYPEYGLSEEDIELVANASALHDIGKIALSDSILLKSGQLTFSEKEEIKKHTIYGCEILENFSQEDNSFYRYCYDICRYHHERYDGTGYPDRLEGDAIPIWAQVVSLVVVYDELVSKRIYREAYAVEEAVRMILDGECGAFSEKVLESFRLSKIEFFQATEQRFSFADASGN